MSYTDGTPPTPAGWYPDPAGSPNQRWWNGVQWTDDLQAVPQAAPAYPSAPAYPPAQGHRSTPGYAGAGPYAGYGSSAPTTVAAGTPVYNVFIWLVTLLPLVSLIFLPLSLGDIDEVMRTSIEDPYAVSPYSGYSAGSLLIQAVTTLFTWLIYAAVIVFSFLDRRWLLRQGYTRPFHWAWSFFTLLGPVGSIVYPIGRSVLVKRQAGRGSAPLWVSIAAAVLSIVVTVVVIVVVITAVVDATSYLNSYA